MRTLLAFALAFGGLLFAADTPALTLIVGNKEENSLAIVDPTDGKVLARVPTGDGSARSRRLRRWKLAFVANYGPARPGSTLSVIDLMTQKEVRKFDISPLRRPAWTRRGRRQGLLHRRGQSHRGPLRSRL